MRSVCALYALSFLSIIGVCAAVECISVWFAPAALIPIGFTICAAYVEDRHHW